MSLLPISLSLRPMYDYQGDLYGRARGRVATGIRCLVLKLVTAGGKTVIASHMIGNALQRNKRCLFIVPILSLLNKTLAGFEEQGITDIGVIQRQHARTNPQARVQLASMQTLIKRPHLMRGFDLVIVDEVHETYQAFYEWMERDTKTVFIGLSATPYTKGMGLHWQGMEIGPSYEELERKGRISPLEVYQPAIRPNRKKVKIVAGEFSESQAEEEMSQKALVADVYDQWVERGSIPEWFVFAQTCNHAKILMQTFEKRGVPCGYIDANTPQEKRDGGPDSLFALYRKGDIRVMFSVGCLGTGIDERVRGISLAYITRSRIKLEQDLGRVRRLAAGKRFGIVNDHGGNIEALGMPEEYAYDHLDTSDPSQPGEAYAGEKEPPKPKKCGNCFMLLPAKTSVCPKCGEKPAVCTVETIEGELVKREKKEPKEKYSMTDKQEWWSQFLGLAEERGKVKGWASHLYKDKFGVWPKGLIDQPAMPERAVVSFEKHRRIAYAKGMAAKKAAQSAGGVNIGVSA